MIRFKIFLPDSVFLDQEVSQVTAEGAEGRFCLMPRHIDCAAPLVPGILSYVPAAPLERENFLALDSGILIKNGDEVMIACRRAVGGSLGELEKAVARLRAQTSEKEKKTRTAEARLEADFVRRFMTLGKHG